MTPFQRDLVNLLKKDSRQPVSTIAKTLNTSRKRVKETIDRLVDQGTITRFSIEIDDGETEKTSARVFFNVRLKQPKCSLLYQQIQKYSEIIGAWSVSSSELDMVLLVSAQTNERIEEIRSEIAQHPVILSMHSNMVLKTWTCEQ